MDNFFDDKTHDTRLLDALKQNAESGALPFHMPGHKRNAKYGHLMGVEQFDVTEIDGFDDLHAASGILRGIEDRAAQVFGASSSRMLVGGSTAGILAAIRALSRAGDGILVARNCHRSVYNAVELAGLRPHYLLPQTVEGGFFGSVSPADVDEALSANPDIRLAVIVSPTYEGVISNVAGIKEVCRRHRVRLIVDGAHGAHLGFGGFFSSACKEGADVVINSLHKTLPSLTQTAILNVVDSALPMDRVDEQLAIFETSSPSYVLMASMDGCIDFLRDNEGDIRRWHNDVVKLREDLKGLKSFKLYDGEGAYAYDVSKLVLYGESGLFLGVRAKKLLRERFGIEAEMAGENYIVAMTGAGDTAEMYAALKNALFALDGDKNMFESNRNGDSMAKSIIKNGEIYNSCQNFGDGKKGAQTEGIYGKSGVLSPLFCRIPEQVLTLSEAAKEGCVKVSPRAAIGEVCGENIWAYPPGCPIIARGERIDEETIDALLAYSENGIEVRGSQGDFPQKISIVARPLDKRRI